jgi:hypothetical protein
MVTLNARNLSLNDVHRFLHFQKLANASFTDLLSLEPLKEWEQQELREIADYFEGYLTESKVSEGLIKVLTIFPLLKLAGFYHSPIKILLEENIEEITVTDEDTQITGRFDILTINKSPLSRHDIAFWILIIEAKNSSVDALVGLPQLLTYAYQSLLHQKNVWGLTTNGIMYQFVYLSQGNPPTYQRMPILSLLESESSMKLLQIMKAICNLQNSLV